MTGTTEAKVHIVTSVEHRRYLSPFEKKAIVEETRDKAAPIVQATYC
jgi:hypothetical protein